MIENTTKNIIRIHKDLNRSAIPFYKEAAIDFFSEIMKRWNGKIEYEKLIFTEKEMKEFLNFKNYDYLSDFLKQFTKDTVAEFKIGNRKITGTAFYFIRYTDSDIVEVHLHEELKEYLFTKKDIELMRKNKNREAMTEIEKKKVIENKEKYKKLMLFSQTELLKFSSKYTKRIYMLLSQYITGFFVMKLSDFKEILLIPESYRISHIENKILKKAEEEFKIKNSNIKIKNYKILENNKKIEIYFFIEKEVKKKNIEKEIEKKIKEQNKKLNEKTYIEPEEEKIDYENLTEKEKEYLEKAKLITKKYN